ncbi:TPA: hypothetical protein HA265_00490 [Candidatus Woesearchaeota archaeon]|nr:hypothetical protein [Candidatus Woesearchaeota archaeon]
MKKNFKKTRNSTVPADLEKYSIFSRGGAMQEFKELNKAVCSDCGKECEVPFKPKDGRPVYCRECYPKHRPNKF